MRCKWFFKNKEKQLQCEYQVLRTFIDQRKFLLLKYRLITNMSTYLQQLESKTLFGTLKLHFQFQ